MVERERTPDRIQRMHPLLEAIGTEIIERSARLARKESLIRALHSEHHGRQIERLRGDARDEARELERLTRELESLGCRIDALLPLTVRIGSEDDESFTWVLGSPPPVSLPD